MFNPSTVINNRKLWPCKEIDRWCCRRLGQKGRTQFGSDCVVFLPFCTYSISVFIVRELNFILCCKVPCTEDSKGNFFSDIYTKLSHFHFCVNHSKLPESHSECSKHHHRYIALRAMFSYFPVVSCLTLFSVLSWVCVVGDASTVQLICDCRLSTW